MQVGPEALRGRGAVRRDQQARHIPQRRLGRQRLLPGHVDGRTGEMAAPQRLGQGLLDDRTAPADVDEERLRPHRREESRVEQADGVGGFGHGGHDRVAAVHQLA